MTKPTRLQEQACERLAEALLLVTEGARLDGKGTFGAADLVELSARLAKASSAFPLDQIVARALEKRGQGLGLRPGTADLLTLLESDTPPLSMLLLPDGDFRELVATMEQELGDV